MILVSLSLVLNVSVVMIYNKGLSGEPLKPWVRTILLRVIAPIVMIYIPGPKKLRREKHKPKRMNNKRPSPTHFPNVNFTQMKAYSRFAGENDELVLNGNKYGGKYSPGMENGNAHGAGENAVIIELRRMNELLASIKNDKTSMRTTQQQGKTSNLTNDNIREWLLLTRVLDRLFFTFYVLACILASVYLVIQINYRDEEYDTI